jgi:HK97 family phage prohead protease/HK97 family phage major capsid protein
MEKIFNLTSTFKALDEDDGGVHICGMASTADFDRAGDTIEAAAWTKGGLNNFEKNPIILFNHDYNKPIGRATGLKVTDNGLELKAKISKSAPDHVAQLVKEGILGAFSVGFRVKDADYLTETDGLKIKDAELFEVSVVSVPCNQAATFSLAKSFDSMDEYEEFKKTFKNSVDLAGQSLAKDEDSLVASDTPDETEETVQKEINMSEVQTPEIDLEAFAKRVADETAAKIAMKQAEEKAAAEAEAKAVAEAAEAEAAKQAEVETVIKTGIESGAERLMADVEAKLAEKDAKIEEVMKQFGAQLAEKEEELTKMRESKRVFADGRSESERLQANKKELVHGHLAGVITGKGWNTEYGQSVLEKAGVSYTATTALGIDGVVSQGIEEEIQLELRLANLFREMPVESQSTVIPLQSDTSFAKWSNDARTGMDGLDNGTGDGVTNRTANDAYTSNTYAVNQKTLEVDRLISTSFLDNYIDEKVLINIMPMLTQSIARAHARAVDKAILQGNGSKIDGLGGSDGVSGLATDSGVSWGAATGADFPTFRAAMLNKARVAMGVYGLNPSELVYVVSQAHYFDLLNDGEFATVDEVGSDMALRLAGQVGMVFGSPVVVSDNFTADVEDGFGGAFCINPSNFVMPRLRGVTVEQDYEVAAQRRILVASQHLGFDELFAGASNKSAAVYVKYNNIT